jgi:hypothetical protein
MLWLPWEQGLNEVTRTSNALLGLESFLQNVFRMSIKI